MGEYSGGRRSYRTHAWIGDRYCEISIELGEKVKGKEMWMSVEIDGKRLLFVRRLRWKFRGNKRLELDGGWIHFSWDLHNSFFQSKDCKPIPKSNYSSLASSTSSASTWSVMEWASLEEVELWRVQGFSLLVYAWKN
ncbi:uncharacterized protein LOC122031339 [Zingiber officinale]|uniref:uncharacterized protein LOC122031339 n=1 Tax=Zingiber officinale TaxID=94328 RepID=UPI001C4D468D|nr:uncharacterized protein LOC122031339 [Zingiber officinale]